MNSDLKLLSKWYDDGLQLVKWSEVSRKVLAGTFIKLRESLIRKLSPYCMHFKGRGGIKGSARCLYRQIGEFPYVARFDVDSYYGSINHNILFKVLDKLKIDQSIMQVIIEYVSIPDTDYKGTGIVAGGALSTLLGAGYLSALDDVMKDIYKKGDIFYIRYMDDIVILAKTRWKLKKSIKLMYRQLEQLKLKMHREEKCFIGKTSKGFSFLGFFFKPGRRLRPSRESLKKFVRRSKQLIEQGADKNRLLSYIERYICYIHAGIRGAVFQRRLYKFMRLIDFKNNTNLTDEIMLLRW